MARRPVLKNKKFVVENGKRVSFWCSEDDLWLLNEIQRELLERDEKHQKSSASKIIMEILLNHFQKKMLENRKDLEVQEQL